MAANPVQELFYKKISQTGCKNINLTKCCFTLFIIENGTVPGFVRTPARITGFLQQLP